jgi:hypothetical protein
MTWAMVLDSFLVAPPLAALALLAVGMRIAAQRINDDRPLRPRAQSRRVEQLARSRVENPERAAASW